MTSRRTWRSAVRRALGPRRSPPPPRPSLVGRPAPALPGAPWAAGSRALLVFVTTSCTPCAAVWDALPRYPQPLVVVTPGPETESRRAVAARDAHGVAVMSSAAWFDYRVPGAPWLVAVVDGTVVGEGRPDALPALAAALGGGLPGR
ncbi:MAG TPA: hypothetical protein VKV25_03365 [Acidimicrobiales bacterium]|nr:hypothetical protein [Acidimicrobiales bacterium]